MNQHNVSIAVTEIAIDGRVSEALHQLEVLVRNLGQGSDLKKVGVILDKLDSARNLPKKDYTELSGMVVVPKNWSGVWDGAWDVK